MSREAHVRIWERVGVRFPCATRQVHTTSGIDGKNTAMLSAGMFRPQSGLRGSGHREGRQ